MEGGWSAHGPGPQKPLAARRTAPRRGLNSCGDLRQRRAPRSLRKPTWPKKIDIVSMHSHWTAPAWAVVISFIGRAKGKEACAPDSDVARLTQACGTRQKTAALLNLPQNI